MIRPNLFFAILTSLALCGCGPRESADGVGGDGSSGAGSPAAETTVQVVESTGPAEGGGSLLAGTFEVELPRGPQWFVVNDGAFNAIEDTFLLAAMNPQRQTYISLSVAPLPHRVQTLDAMKPIWEISFLKNAAKKISSEELQIGRRDAYRLVAVMEGPDKTRIQLLGILMVADGRSYTLGVTKPASAAGDDPEVEAFISSFRITDGRD